MCNIPLKTVKSDFCEAVYRQPSLYAILHDCTHFCSTKPPLTKCEVGPRVKEYGADSC